MTPYRHKELKYFCLQYEEKKVEMEQLAKLTKVTHDSVSDSLEGKEKATIATKLAKLGEEITLIEQTARFLIM